MHQGALWPSYEGGPTNFLSRQRPASSIGEVSTCSPGESPLVFSIQGPPGASRRTRTQRDAGRAVRGLEVNCRLETGLVSGEL